ncbi:IS66 family transposase [Parabacteroides sp. AM08-6]|nr:IS66 family transposase [Parabacteroides sp. AM08-6]
MKPGVSYGVNIHALVAYLSTAQHIPFKRLVEVLNDFYGLKMSQGSVSNILNRMRKQGLSRYDEIKQEILSSPVIGADETGMRLDKKLYWMWVFQNELATFVFPDHLRGKEAIDGQFPKGFPDGILVTDRHSSYFGMTAGGHQICLAHLLRKLIYLTELDQGQDWSTRMLSLLRESIHLWKTRDVTKSDMGNIKKHYKALMEEDISRLRHEFREFRNGLSSHSDHLFLFLENPNVPPDNNASERAIRPLKVKQKVSGQFKSDEGASAFCVIHSIVHTAKKKDQDPFLALREIAENVINHQT